MKRMALGVIPCLATVLAAALPAQVPTALDPFRLTAPKRFEAFRSSSNNPDWASNDDSKRPIPGETVVLADLTGPGVITHLWITVAANEYGWPRLLRLRVYYDGSSIPSVDAPLGDFFAVGHGLERPINSTMERSTSSGRSRNAYWPMPFRKSAKVTITNEGRRRVANLYYHVDWSKYPALPANTPYFHARYRQALPTRLGGRYEILRTRGQGHYVGTVLSVIQNQPGWFGEGDDFFFVDGKARPNIEGTGTEDYFNDAWSFRVGDSPYYGVTVAEGTDMGSRMTAYRWHVADPVPFAKALKFEIEHSGWTYNQDGSVRSAAEEREDLFSSVAFWYQQGIARDQPEPPYGAARLPHGNAVQQEVERAADLAVPVKGKVSVQKEVFWSKDILFFEAEGPGSKIDIPFEVPEDGRYEVVAQTAGAPDYGSYEMLIDGKSPSNMGLLEHEPGANVGAGPRFDGYYSELFVGEDRVIGWPRLNRGKHTVTFVCVGKNAASTNYFLGVDALVVARVAGEYPARQDAAGTANPADRLRRLASLGPAAAAHVGEFVAALTAPSGDVRVAGAYALGQLGSTARSARAALVGALGDSDHVVRGLAALALRNIGPGDPTAVVALAAHLGDPDDGVRMMSGWALAAQGAGALPAVAALIEAGRVPGQNAHVQRAVADALGAIGPAARDALPVLLELEKVPRVRWNASAAIRRVRGQTSIKEGQR